MDYNSLMAAVVSRHRNTLITLKILRIAICSFHVRPVWSTFTNSASPSSSARSNFEKNPEVTIG